MYKFLSYEAPDFRGVALRSSGLSLGALAIALAATPVAAQDVRGPEREGSSQAMDPASTATPVEGSPADPAAADDAPSIGLEDIVVTARKVAENQQDVPVAITAFTGEALQQQNAVRVIDVARLTPGLTMREGTSTNTTLVIAIRGQVQTDVLATLDPSVGTYVDGVYWARSYGLNSDLLDLQSVQVLKGPQGTLFGRNTTGGAILFQTNDPNFQGVAGRFSGSLGNLDLRSGTAVVNVPLVADKLAIRAAIQRTVRDGYLKDVGAFNGGDDYNDRNSWAARGKVLFQATDNLSVLLSGEYFRARLHGPGRRTAYFVPNGLVPPAPTTDVLAAAAAGRAAQIAAGITPTIPAVFAYPATLAAGAGAAFAGGTSVLGAYVNSLGADRDITQLNETPRNRARAVTFTGTVNLDTYFGAVKFVGAYRKVKQSAGFDLDGSPFALHFTSNDQTLKQYSGELQITGKAFSDAVDFAAGAFYFNESGIDGSFSTILPVELRALPVMAGTTLASSQIFSGEIFNDSMGAYAQATWHITDALGFTGGVRYSVDDKGLTTRNQNLNRTTGTVPGNLTQLLTRTGTLSCAITGLSLANQCALTAKDDFHGWSYTAGLDYKINDDVLVYIKTSKGFRSGGQNLRAATIASAVPFDPEVAYSYEGGLKSEFFDRRVRFNLAGYYSEINDLQRTTLLVIGAGTSTVIGNVGKARVYGLEAELTTRPFEGLTLSATAGVTKPKYLDYNEVPSVTNLTGDRRNERFDSVPEKTFSVSALYEHEFDFAKLRLRGDYSYTDSFALSSQGFFTGDPLLVTIDPRTGRTVATEILDALTAPSAHLLSGQISASFNDDAIEVTLFGRNLTNNRARTLALYVGTHGAVGEDRREPRTYGISASFRFGP